MKPDDPRPKQGAADPFAGLGDPTDPIPFRRDARTGALPSGLRYFILENSMPENRASVRLVVNAGYLHEEDDEQGLAHFVEHMAFKGTERFPGAGAMDAYLRSLGMPPGNAVTFAEKTVYQIDVPMETDAAGRRAIPPAALAIIDDWSRAVAFDPEALEIERLVIVEEHRRNLGASERIGREWTPALFRGSRFAERTPIGRPEIVETAPAAQLEGFYKKWYRADNMTLVFVGDFDGAALEASLPGHFHIGKPDSPTPRPEFDLPPPESGTLETLTLTDPELTGTDVKLYFKRARKPPRYDLAAFLEHAIDSLILLMMFFRFSDAALKPETPYIGAETDFAARYGRSSRFYAMSAVAKSGLAGETLAELLNAAEAVKRHGFTDAEIALAGEALLSYKRGLVRERDKQDSAMLATLYAESHVEAGGLPDFEWELDAIRHFLSRLGAERVNAVAGDYFAGDDLRVFVFAPESERDTLPNDADIRRLAANRERSNAAPPKAAAAGAGLLPKPPERGAIVSQSIDDEAGAVLWELGNGARVALKATDNMNDEIVLEAMARGGVFCAPPDEYVSAVFAAGMMEASGVGPWSCPDMIRFLASRQVSFSHWIDVYTRGFRGTSTVGDLATLFEMLHLCFANPRIDPDAARATLDGHRTELSLRGEDPAMVFSDEIIRALTGDHPRCGPPKPADLDRVDMDAALAFLRRGLNPADFTFVFTGNLAPDLLRPHVETYLASLPRKAESWNAWTDLGIPRPGDVERNVRRGREEQGMVYMGWFAPAVFDEGLNVASQALGGYLNVRLNDEIRENLGGVYAIGAEVGLTPIPRGELSLQAQFTCDPRRVEELSRAVAGLLDEAATGTVGAVFDGVLEAMHQEWEAAMQSNSFIAQNYANSAALLDMPLARLHRQPGYIAAVTPAGIQAIAARLSREGLVKVVLLPGR